MDNIPLRYPVVLVHGIYAHDRKGRLKFWGRIPETLTEKGIQVFFGNTDAWGDVESNAAVLKETIEKTIVETKKEKVNIIAHSKGGIDSRFLIWKYQFGGKVASLTTICTPHHGADLAGLIDKQKIVHTRLSRKALKVFDRLCGDANPDLYNVTRQLTAENMEAFNQKVQIDSGVYYQSLYTTMKNAFDDWMFYYPYIYTKIISGDNDGIVSERSAKWGKNTGKISGGISHAEILDIKQKTISGIRIPDIYVDIVRDLAGKGY